MPFFCKHIALILFVQGNELAQNVLITAGVPDATDLGHPDSADHSVHFFRSRWLSGDIAMSNVVVLEEAWCFLKGHMATGAAPVFDVEVARYILWMRRLCLHFVT